MDIFTLVGKIVVEGLDTLQSGLEKVETQVKANKESMDKYKETLKTLGTSMTVVGASVTAAMGLSVKAAEEDRQASAKLSNTLKNLGINYEDVEESITAVTNAQMKKTNYSDGDQIEALNQLLLVTGDYNLALEALPTVLDLASAKNMDASSAASLVGKALSGNTEALSRYGITLSDTATPAENLNAIMCKVKGSAEAGASSFTIVKNETASLSSAIGSFLLPIIITLINTITPLISGLTNWMQSHQTLSGVIVVAVAGLGVLLTVVGGLLLALPTIVNIMTAWKALTSLAIIQQAAHTAALVAHNVVVGLATAAQWLWNLAMDANPIGLLIIAVAALIAIVVLLVQNWDTVRAFFIQLWDNIKSVFQSAIDWISNFIDEAFTAIKEWLNQWGLVIITIIFPLAGAIAYMIKYRDTIWTYVTETLDQVEAWFAAIPGRIGDAISSVVDVFKDTFNTVYDFLSTLPDAIVNLFSTLPTRINKIFAAIATKIKETFQDVVNRAVKAINRLITGINAVGAYLGIHISYIPEVSLAKGGVAMRPGTMVANFGENAPRDPEVFAPLSQLKEMLGLTTASATAGSNITIQINNPSVRSDQDIDNLVQLITDRVIEITGAKT